LEFEQLTWIIVHCLPTNLTFWLCLPSATEERLKQKKILFEIEGITNPSSLLDNRRSKFSKIETTNHGMRVFSFESIELATDNFSSANKLGEGGFGPVYKVRYRYITDYFHLTLFNIFLQSQLQTLVNIFL